MALLEEEPAHPVRTLLLLGVPSFLLAVVISLVTHQYAHVLLGYGVCGAAPIQPTMLLISLREGATPCAVGALAGPVWTLGLGLASFALLLRNPNNLFFASMAFVNATTRLPQTVTVFVQLLMHNATRLVADESSSIALLGLRDATIPTVIMCFYSILLVFFSVIVVHDIRRVPYKWAVALGCLLFLGTFEQAVWNVIGGIFW